MGVLNKNGALYLAFGVDTSGLKKGISEAESLLEGFRRTAVNVGKAVGVALTFDAAKELVGQIASVRGEFQKLEVSLTGLLKSKSKANALLSEMATLASTTPFSLQDVARGSRQLLAYGFDANEVTKSLKMLGDVAAGMNLPLERLVYLYGTTMTQGRLYTRDLMQFTTSGIPMVEALAEQFGVAKEEVGALVEAGRVGFPEIKKAFEDMTGVGGKFHGMMDELSETVSGRFEKLKDAVELMYNEIGKSGQGAMYTAIDGAAKLVENYKQVGAVLAELIASFGLYKTAVMAANVYREAGQNVAYEAKAKELFKLLNAEQQAAISKKNLKTRSLEYYEAVKNEVEANQRAANSAVEKAKQQAAAAYQSVKADRDEIQSAKELQATREAELRALQAEAETKRTIAAQSRLTAAENMLGKRESLYTKASDNYDSKQLELDTLLKKENTAATNENAAANQKANAAATQAAIERAKKEVEASQAIMEKRREELQTSQELVRQRREELQTARAAAVTAKDTAQKNLSAAANARARAESKLLADTEDLAAKKIALNTVAKQANTLATNANATAAKANVSVSQKMGEASSMLAGKLGMVAKALSPAVWMIALSAVMELIRGIYEYATALTDAERVQQAMSEISEEVEAGVSKERYEIESLIETIKNENTTKSQKLDAQNRLLEISPSIYNSLMNEKGGQEALTAAVNDYIAARRLQLSLMSVDTKLNESFEREAEYNENRGDIPFYKKAGAAVKAYLPLLNPLNKMDWNDLVKGYDDNMKIEYKAAADQERLLQKNLVNKRKNLEREDQIRRDNANRENKNVVTLIGLSTNLTNAQVELSNMRKKAATGATDAELAAIRKQEALVNGLSEQIRLMTGSSPKGDTAAGGGGANTKGGGGGKNKHLKDLEQQQKEAEEALKTIGKLMADAQKDIDDYTLDAMEEGQQKRMRKLDINFKREMAEVETWKARIMEANKKATGKEDLTSEQETAYETSKNLIFQKDKRARAAIVDEWKRKEADAYDEMLQAFGSYKEKQEAIAREYARKIADAEKEGRTNEADKLRAEQAREAATLADKELGNNEALVFFFKYAEKQSLKTAKAAQSYIANVLEYLRTKGKSVLSDMSQKPFLDQLLGDEEKTKEAIERFTNDLDKAKEVVQSIGNQKVFDALINNFKRLKKAAAGSQEQMSALNGVTGGLSTIGGMVTQLGNAMADCDIKAGKVVVTVGNTITSIASFAAAGTSVAGVWGAIVGAVVGAASAIIPAIGKIDEWSQSLEKSYDSQLQWLDKARDANIELIKGYGSVAEKIDLATKAIENNVKALELLYQKSRELREYQSEDKNGHSVWYMDRQKVATAIRDMGAFENYDEWEKTHVTDAKKRYEYNKYVRNPKNVHSTQGVPLLLEAMQNGYVPIKIKAEFDKQGLDLQKFLDDPSKYLLNDKEGALNYEQMKWLQDTYPALLGALDSRQRELVEQRMEHLKKESEGVKKALEESLAGVSYDTLLSEYESALKTMGDGAAALGKNIENHLRDAIIKGLIDGKTKERIKKAYDRIIEIMKKRDTMSAEEYQKELQDARTELEGIYKELREQKRLAFEKAGIKEDDEVKDNTLRGALAKASQESIDLLAGQMGAVRVLIEQIVTLMQASVSGGSNGSAASFYVSVQAMIVTIRDIQAAGWKEVTAIKDLVTQVRLTQGAVADLTKTISDNTTSIKESSRKASEALVVMNNSGVKLKGGGFGA